MWSKTIEKDWRYNTLIPPYKDGSTIIYGQNRNSDTEKIRYGTLKSIKYPTGGQTTFDFEAHGLYLEVTPPPIIEEKQGGTTNFNDVYNGYAHEWTHDDFTNNYKEGEPFEMSSYSTFVVFKLNVEYLTDDPPVLEDFWEWPEKSYTAFLKKYNEATGRYETIKFLRVPPVCDRDICSTEVDLTLTKGTYRIDIERSFSLSDVGQHFVFFEMIRESNCTFAKRRAASDSAGGGLRIKTVESTDLNGNTTQKKYEYYEGNLMTRHVDKK